MVIGRFKGSNFLHIVSTVIKLGCQEVHRINGMNVLHVRCPNGIVEYKKNIFGMDRCDQHRTVEVKFTNVDHLQKYYKQYFLGIADFILLQ